MSNLSLQPEFSETCKLEVYNNLSYAINAFINVILHMEYKLIFYVI